MRASDEVLLGMPRYGAAPRAGRRFVVRMSAEWQDGVAIDRGTISCVATARGRRIASVGGTVAAGSASCAFRVPARAARRRMSLSITVTDTARNLARRTVTLSVRR
jgi:hypothetical protein